MKSSISLRFYGASDLDFARYVYCSVTAQEFSTSENGDHRELHHPLHNNAQYSSATIVLLRELWPE